MSHTNSNSNNLYVRTLCAILFYTFVFFYLYIYQQDLLMLTQHLCSGGTTHYHPIIGTGTITILLALLQFGVGRLLRSFSILYALSYVPSFIVLAALTGIQLQANGYTFGVWPFMLPISLTLYALIIIILMRINIETKSMFHYTQQTIIISNTLIMLVGFLFTGLTSNSSATLHTQLKVERLLSQKQYDDALNILKQANNNSPSLSMLTAYTLSLKGELPEKLFTYSVAKGAQNLTPDSLHTRMAFYPEGKLFHHIGVYPIQRMGAHRYLDYLYRHHLGKRPFTDYYLMALLLDKKIDTFVAILPTLYDVHGPLPTHYREALLLYTHLRTNPSIIFHSNIMDADFQDFQTLENKYLHPDVRRNAMRDTYGNTYWYYFLYE